MLWGDFILTNINCSCDCKYQSDGKCHLENVKTQKISPNKDCIYFSSKWDYFLALPLETQSDRLESVTSIPMAIFLLDK